MEWKRESGDVVLFVATGGRLTARVAMNGEWWVVSVLVRADPVHISEHESRDDAMRAAEDAAQRACDLRRFDADPPRCEP